MSRPKVEKYTLHSDKGLELLDKKRTEWTLQHMGKPDCNAENSWGFGKVTYFSWYVGEQRIEVPAEKWIYAEVLPDASGFIGFEKGWNPNNCLLFDAYGKERMRLTVPWELTKSKNPESANPPTSFANVSEPYINPVDGKEGLFGVTAWVEHAGKYYFELDYHTGQFLWGKGIRD